jgi:hypothetical protein
MNTFAKMTERDQRDAVGARPFSKVTPPVRVVKLGYYDKRATIA